MSIMKKRALNYVIRGTIILTLTGGITRFIGFYNRIFLSNLIGAKELGIYQLILPLYMVVFSFTSFGNELALTKLVAEYIGRKDYASSFSLLRICIFINLFLSVFSSFIICKNANWICLHILNAVGCEQALRIICLAFPFMAIKAAYHGFFLGLKKPEVHGFSDLMEQSAKVFGVMIFAYILFRGSNYNVNFAIWGIVLGEFVGFLYTFIYYLRYRNSIQITTTSVYYKTLIKLFIKDTIPLSLNRFVLTVLQSMESILIPSVLLSYYQDSYKSLSIYGIFSGMAFPFIMFPATVTNSLSTMLLPAVSNTKSTLNYSYLKKLCQKSFCFSFCIGILSFVVFYFFGYSIGVFFFKTKEAGIFLYRLSFLCPFIYTATTLASILNGLGCASYNLFVTILSIIIRISFIIYSIPKTGMNGYLYGLLCSYTFLTIAYLLHLRKKIIYKVPQQPR